MLSQRLVGFVLLALVPAAACTTGCGGVTDDGSPVDGGSGGHPDGGSACAAGADVYAAPGGSGSACSCDAPCSLDGARDRARSVLPSLRRDLVVELADGTYSLTAPWVLSAADSGQPERAIIYRAADGATPVLSGGLRVGGFAPAPDGPAGVQVAAMPPGTRSRQLYVGGRRATRARGGDNPPGYSLTATGFTLADPAIASWPDRGALEVVGLKQWKSFRCGVQDVSVKNGLSLQQPCFGYSQEQAGSRRRDRSTSFSPRCASMDSPPGERGRTGSTPANEVVMTFRSATDRFPKSLSMLAQVNAPDPIYKLIPRPTIGRP